MAHTFGPFTLDPGTRRLLRGDRELPLSPKAFDLLHYLIENRTRAVPRTELHQRLWPSTFVLETNLASLVAEIRRALGDSADDPAYVRTVHRLGYWFIGRISKGDASIEADQAAIKYWLVWETRQVPLAAGDNIIGRAPDAAVWLDAAGVSRHHARIVASAAPTVEDLGSKNGTFLGGRRVTTPQPLADGDQIRFGSVVVTFRIPPDVGSTDTVRSH